MKGGVLYYAFVIAKHFIPIDFIDTKILVDDY